MKQFSWALILGFCSLGISAVANQWPSWRGVGSTGSTTGGKPPISWDTTNGVLWKVAMPGKGCSTPVVWDGGIFVTAPTNGQDGVLAFTKTGKPQWQRTFGSEKSGKHKNGSGCNPSPVTDGKTLAVYFKSGTLAALDLMGKLLWQTNLTAGFGPENLFWDQGTSPVLTRRSVILARMHGGESWLAAFDKLTGELQWKADRTFKTAVEGDHSYSTPLVIEHDGAEAVLTWGAEHVTVNDAANGRLKWRCGGFNPRESSYWPAVASPVISAGIAIIASGRADRGQPFLDGIRLGGTGEVTSTHRVWRRDDVGTFVPSPAVYEGRVFIVSDKGAVECIEPASGKTVWKDAFPKTGSNFYASPLIMNGVLYAIREDGIVFVVNIQHGFKLLAEIPMHDRIIASPVPLGDCILIRGERNLYCISGLSKRSH